MNIYEHTHATKKKEDEKGGKTKEYIKRWKEKVKRREKAKKYIRKEEKKRWKEAKTNKYIEQMR